jgi:ATP-dependent Lhr-like helicase
MNRPPWHELVRMLRRMELRGDVRGGRFISGVGGEQFALESVIAPLRALRDAADDGEWVLITAADPLNLSGILTAGPRIAAINKSALILQRGRCVAAKVAGRVEFFAQVDPATQVVMRRALQIGRRAESDSGKPLPAR